MREAGKEKDEEADLDFALKEEMICWIETKALKAQEKKSFQSASVKDEQSWSKYNDLIQKLLVYL